MMNTTEQGVAPNSTYYAYTPSVLAKSIFLYPVITGLFRYQAGYSLQRNAFDSFLIMYIRQGQCKVKVNGRTFDAGARQVVLLNCYEPHSYWTAGGCEIQWLHFDGPVAAGYYHAIISSGSPVITLTDTYRLEKYLHKLYLQFQEGAPIKEATMNNYIVNILTELFVSKEAARSETIPGSIIEDTIAYINEHLTDSLPLEELARQAALSPFYFSRLFKKETGFSPHEYLIAARINNAKYLLKSTNAAIKDICFRSGFSTESSFCTAFKKVTGITPIQYRLSNPDDGE